MKLDFYGYTNRGGRDYNEDSFGQCLKENQAIFVLADGLGGHFGGKQASESVVKALINAWKMEVMDNTASEDINWEAWLKEQILNANDILLAMQNGRKNRLKSTVAVLCLDKDTAYWAYVGDSRLYFLSEGKIFLLTEDHSVTYKKYKAGEISKEEINFDEDRASLLRTVGNDSRCLPDSGCLNIENSSGFGRGFLLCSDGFWEYLREEEILVDYLKTAYAEKWGKQMLLRIMERIRPDSDNLTFTAVRIQEDNEE